MAENSNHGISEVFALLCDVAIANGATNINKLPGCYVLTVGKAWIAFNARAIEQEAIIPNGASIRVRPHGITMLWNGWPVYMGDAGGGCVIGMSEDELVEKIKSLHVEQS